MQYKQPKIYFREDGNTQIGLGHIRRFLALANMLKEDFDCLFLVQNPSETLQKQIQENFRLIILPETEDYLQEAKFIKESYLKEQDVLVLEQQDFGTIYQKVFGSKLKSIQSLCNELLSIREANKNDMQIYFEWANDKEVRKNAFHTEKIVWENHQDWFSKKLANPDSMLYIFEIKSNPLGQVRIDFENNMGYIDYSLDTKYRGQGLGKVIVEKAIQNLKQLKTNFSLKAQVKKENLASVRVFEKLNFRLEEENKQILNFILDVL